MLCQIDRLGLHAAVLSSNGAALDNIHDKLAWMKKNNGSDRGLADRVARLGSMGSRDKFSKAQDKVRFNSGGRWYCRTGPDDPVVCRSGGGQDEQEKWLAAHPDGMLKPAQQEAELKSENMAVLESYGVSNEENEELLSQEEQKEADRLLYQTCPEFFEDCDEVSRQALEEEERWVKKLYTYIPQYEVSFFDLCMKVFGPSEPEKGEDILPWTSYKVFLNEHYRFHPGIIEFCNQTVYDGRLQIKTKGTGVPIKILYYEGDYCQRWANLHTGQDADSQEDSRLARLCDIAQDDWHYCLPPKKRPASSSKYNAKQVEIFMEEEWEELYERMKAEEELTVCILSPFNGQLNIIQHAIERHFRDVSVTRSNLYSAAQQMREDTLSISREKKDETAPGASTVNKAQGKEYDIVYLLPAEDGDWEGAFSQKQRMVNVAVSRAKKELRIITSTKYMSAALQKELKLNVQYSAGGQEEDKGEHYLRRLADYVWSRRTENDAWARGGEFGFHKTALVSIFDDKELVAREEKLRAEQEKPSAGQRLVGKVLTELIRDKAVTLKSEVPVRDVLEQLGRGGMENVSARHGEIFQIYVENGASFDFVLYQDGRPFLAVEVDGAYHRFPLIKKINPEEKDKRVEERYQDFRKRWLLDRIKDALVLEAMRGWVFHGNTKLYADERKVDDSQTDQSETDKEAKEDQWERAEGDFALLRLPDDGTTYLETDELQASAPKALAEKVFTLEELIARYRPGAPSSGETLSLSCAIRTWMSEESQERVKAALSGKGNLASKLQSRLAEMGLLEHNAGAWHPTSAGRALGIGELEGRDAKGKRYIYPVYSQAAWEQVKKRLLEESGS